MATKTFKRYELKYFVTPQQYQMLCETLLKYMEPDEFCRDTASYMIYNLYFDTADDAVIRRSLSKPYYKEKLRMRSYSLLDGENDMVFLELKKKIGGIVAKRRAVVSYQEALYLVSSKKMPGSLCPLSDGERTGPDNYQDRQVMEEILDFLDRYTVVPKVYISYERSAFFGKDDREFRISFDRGILTRRKEVSLLAGDYGSELLEDGEYLMEVKCAGAMPLWLCSLMSSLGIYLTSFSKYGTEYRHHVS